ncbi:MAG TPA: NADH-dependent [FeFe] hydrogenase, group A6 [Candidatus Omnitrophota bacterium]|nr:[FeFe] hydrogenase, group A [Candidatus Omnitrophota bacterium]HQO58119.1 NADH-dependent [FeFe] hydrogenase, group A6 [Candidatus Omnitrophota bacterium]
MGKAVINNMPVEFEPGMTILEAAERIQVKIPTLCYHPDIKPTAACGICVVKAKGSAKMLRACCTPIEDGMDIITHDPEIVAVRRTVVEMILSTHPNDCLTCGRNKNCELQTILADFGIREETFEKIVQKIPKDVSTGTLVLEPSKCIKCGRCVSVCQEAQNVWALSFLERGASTRFAPTGDISLSESPCVRCGQCSAHCPTGAIFEYDQTARVWEALQDPDKICIVQIAPSVRVALGEGFGFPPGTNLTRKIYALLRRMGFKAVFDTNFSADVTIMEEASEFVDRFLYKKGPLPLVTTCCPAWVDFMEKFQADMIEHFSSAKSPQAMLSSLAKTYYPQKAGLDPAKIFMVSIMPCTAKKYEITRSHDMSASGFQDTDVVLTTREMIRMIKQMGIDFRELPDEDPDHLLGDYSGAGVIFGATGGVMEAALRTAYYFITKENLKDVNFRNVRGLKGVKETSVSIHGTEVKIAVAHGLANVEYVLNKVRTALKNGEPVPYHFIEVMACPGGCIGGGGQPYGVNDEVRAARAQGLYEDDEQCTVRYSHENPYIKQLYAEFLQGPLSEKAHHLLHTKYVPRPEYKK